MNSARILILMASATLLAGTANARKLDLPFMPSGELADAPEGFLAMCQRDQALCSLGGSGDARSTKAVTIATALNAPTGFTLSYRANRQVSHAAVGTQPPSRSYEPAAAMPRLEESQLAHEVKRINTQVNRAVIQMADRNAIGIDEYWMRLAASAHPVGDCEDIAIEKRILLMEAGFPADRLFYGVAYVRTQGLHTVLIARLADGDYVLDSLSPHIVRWQAVTSYTWLRHQTPGKPLQWRRMDLGAEPRTYASGQAPAVSLPAPVPEAPDRSAAGRLVS